MNEFKTIDDILDFAIAQEEKAAALYERLAGEVKSASTRKFFEGLIQEELRHKKNLMDVKAGKKFSIAAGAAAPEKVMDLKIADYLVEVQPDKTMDYRQALIMAMHAEKAEFRLYKDLAERAETDEMKRFFEYLANEEAKHKLQLELEYDDHILEEG